MLTLLPSLLSLAGSAQSHILPRSYPASRSGYQYTGDGGTREGSYYISGLLSDFSSGALSSRDWDHRRRDYQGDLCPYDNMERKRTKRDAEGDGAKDVRNITGSGSVSGGGLLVDRIRRELIGDDRYKDDWDSDEGRRGRLLWDDRYREDRYRDDRYRDDRYRDDRYRDDRYREDRYRDDRYRDDRYRDDRYRDDRYRDDRDRDDPYIDDRYRNRDRRDRCGRQPCSWEAELECDPSRQGAGRGYRSDYVRWERENDAYYPRDKYRDVLEYLGPRGREEGTRLIISRVRPEDKGVYRCYMRNGRPEDFMEVHFYPKFPAEDNEEC